MGGNLPRPPKTWPNYPTLGEWGCEACHAPHFAPTAENLLNFTSGPSPFSCTTSGCHTSSPGPPHLSVGGPGGATTLDIGRQVRKLSAHHETPGRVGGGRRGGPGVGCADCHNPHVGTTQKAEAPYASGLLRGVGGIDRNGGIVASATYEYEVCFKCHGDNTTDLQLIQRVVPGTNTRLAFALDNPSYHPVLGTGKNLNIPSLPSSFEPGMSAAQTIYCTSCHADDEGGSKGPHGSSFRPILKERYETADFTPESFENYALCYRCHDRSSILRNDSFRKKTVPSIPGSTGGGHSGHLAAGGERIAHESHQLRRAHRDRQRGRGPGVRRYRDVLRELHALVPRHPARQDVVFLSLRRRRGPSPSSTTSSGRSSASCDTPVSSSRRFRS